MMPPFGLYNIPRNHLYGGSGFTSPPRRAFNSKDFADDDDDTSAGAAALSTANRDGARDATTSNDAPVVKAQTKEMKAEKKKSKKERRRSKSKGRNSFANASKASSVTTPVTEERKEKKVKEAKSSTSLNQATKNTVKTPKVKTAETPITDDKAKRDKTKKSKNRASESRPFVAPPSAQREKGPKTNCDDQTQKSAKKRKRESLAMNDSKKSKHTPSQGFLVGQSLVENIDAAIHGVRAPDPPQETASTAMKPPSKTKAKGKSDVNTDKEQPLKAAEKGHGARHDVPFKGSSPSKVIRNETRAPVMNGHMIAAVSPAKPSKTPVPLPHRPNRDSPNVATGASEHSAILVPETPPSINGHASKILAPVPFPQLSLLAASRKQASQDERPQIAPTPVLMSEADIFSSAPVNSQPTYPGVPNALTVANLQSFKEPLSTTSKPRPRPKRRESTTTSMPDSSAASQVSIQDAFARQEIARVGKPYERSAAFVDPFAKPADNNKDKIKRQTHVEASAEVFEELYRAAQKTVNFTEEIAYLHEFLDWHQQFENVPLQCLGQMTGCSSKKEEIMRLSREENMTILSHLETEGGDPAILASVDLEAEYAENLLLLCTQSLIPVPIGVVEGNWTLYCPNYAETHVDRYGYGKRNLMISSIAGFKHKNTYTARLQLPPRTMSYTLQAFQTPPHASFRTTRVMLAAERYPMDLIFLGNGYLHLRVDMRLLLTGKAADEVEGKKSIMQFIGMHEKAQKWTKLDDKDELEEEIRKKFRKYDGGIVNGDD